MLIKSMVIVSQKQEQVHLQTLKEIQIRPAFPKKLLLYLVANKNTAKYKYLSCRPSSESFTPVTLDMSNPFSVLRTNKVVFSVPTPQLFTFMFLHKQLKVRWAMLEKGFEATSSVLSHSADQRT